MLAFLIFADGCAAALVTGEPRGLRLGRSSTAIATEAADQITWRIGAHGFDMSLSGAVPASIGALCRATCRILHGCTREQVVHWAVHPGGRSVLDAVERALKRPRALEGSREVLRRYGNMSSPTILFVLAAMLSGAPGRGCAGIRPRPLDRACCSRCSGDRSAGTQPRPELMDTERVDLATFEACLKDLEWINRWTGPTESRSAGSNACARRTMCGASA